MTTSLWFAVVLMVVGAVMLVAGLGSSGLWIAVVTLGIAMVVLARYNRTHHTH